MRYSVEQLMNKILKTNKEVTEFSIFSDEIKFSSVQKEYCFEISNDKTSNAIDFKLFNNSVLRSYIKKRVDGKYINLISIDSLEPDRELMKIANIYLVIGIIMHVIVLYIMFDDLIMFFVFLIISLICLYFEYRARNLLKYIKIRKSIN